MDLKDLKNILEKFYNEYKLKGSIDYHGLENEINKYNHIEMTKKFVEVLELINGDNNFPDMHKKIEKPHKLKSSY